MWLASGALEAVIASLGCPHGRAASGNDGDSINVEQEQCLCIVCFLATCMITRELHESHTSPCTHSSQGMHLQYNVQHTCHGLCVDDFHNSHNGDHIASCAAAHKILLQLNLNGPGDLAATVSVGTLELL